MRAATGDPMPSAASAFAAPWQARAHALVSALLESGALEAADWARRLGEVRAAQVARSAQPARASPSAQSTALGAYAGAGVAAAGVGVDEPQAEHWGAVVEALEGWMRDRGLAAPLQLAAWRVTLAAVPGAALGASLGRRDDPPA